MIKREFGYFEIGIHMAKTHENVGTLWRSAYQLGAAGIFTIGRRYQKQASDTAKCPLNLPLRQYAGFDDFVTGRPQGARIVGVEMGGKTLSEFKHPDQCVYLLGSEDNGLPANMLERCDDVVSIEAIRTGSYNVAVAGSLIMYHRMFGSM